jgi:hypothetical protein
MRREGETTPEMIRRVAKELEPSVRKQRDEKLQRAGRRRERLSRVGETTIANALGTFIGGALLLAVSRAFGAIPGVPVGAIVAVVVAAAIASIASTSL